MLSRRSPSRAKADWARLLRLGRPTRFQHHRFEMKPPEQSMHYVYILRSEVDADRHYVGQTQDLKARLERHNRGEVTHTSKYRPWTVQTYLAFDDERRALAFETYLKSGSGRAFARKRL